DLAVILPTYNESKNIRDLILAIERLKMDSLILVIDDSSPDGTQDIVRGLQKGFDNIMLVVRPCKMGLGTAIRDGFRILASLADRPAYIVTMDADFSHNPADILRLLQCAMRGYGVVVGSRYVEGGAVIGWSLSRIIISRVANRLAKVLIRLPVRDFTSGFRCYSMEYVLGVLSRLRSRGFEIQIETLRLAQLLGVRVAEAPITFVNRKLGRSKLSMREVVSFLLYLMRALFIR
ncbi:MAG: polyprenol monophosphomannose synthase, partial [Candidatus Bathyarchaeia archaeon]